MPAAGSWHCCWRRCDLVAGLLRVLEQEEVLQQQALDAARESLRLIENQYRAGTVDFNSVVNVQATALNNERSNLTLLGRRLPRLWQNPSSRGSLDYGTGRWPLLN
ncbi:Outer membrane efflux protein [Pseudomonas borbori]|uniref:Outer membrane efflux protein n=1 Tax=Pseudomonas borbori TaxID=289003 RepID=A0A1I5UWM1_9PSED|nr:Outer membrane efflux protein [Pseudomonas borbori]